MASPQPTALFLARCGVGRRIGGWEAPDWAQWNEDLHESNIGKEFQIRYLYENKKTNETAG
jgi:hypothetical protein